MPLAQPGLIRIELDDCSHGGASCTIYRTWHSFEATAFCETRSEALSAAVAQWRRHIKHVRTKEAAVAKNVSNDPTMYFARMLEEDIAAERSAQALANVASRFYVDDAENDCGIKPRQEAA